jgi:hypothetical protein
MSTVAYARVSSGQQDHGSQVQRLKDAGAEKVFLRSDLCRTGPGPSSSDASSTSAGADTLLITKLDRLARSTSGRASWSWAYSPSLPSSRPRFGESGRWRVSLKRRLRAGVGDDGRS